MSEWTTRPVVRARPRRIHLVVIAAFVVATIATISKLPQVIRAAKPEPVSATMRALAPARFYGVDPQLIVGAARGIPRNATFAVVGGDGVRSHLVRAAEISLLPYWLLPRRETGVRSSEWIVSVGGDLQSLGLRYARVVSLGRGVKLAEVRR